MNKQIEMFSEYPSVLSVEEMQKALQIGRSSAYGLLRSNEIKHIRIGRVIRIPKSSLLQYVSNIQ